MRNIKKLLALILIICMFCCFIGCTRSNPDNATPTTETLPIDTTPDSDSIEITLDDQEEIVREVLSNEQMVWEKPEKQMTLGTIKISKDWDKFIIVDEIAVSAIDYTDMSMINNYYYGSNDSYANLETAYYVPTYRLSMMTNDVYFDEYISAIMNIVGTTNDAHKDKHVVIEEINFITTVNPYEGGLDTLKTNASYTSDGYFGIGSTHSYIENIIGKANSETTTPMIMGINLTNCVYIGENAEMIMTFMWNNDDGIDTATLTSIDWIATKISSDLHTQEGIDFFENRSADVGD